MSDRLPVGAYVASALAAANYGGDSGEDVDHFLNELESRGYAVVPLAVALAAEAATDGASRLVTQNNARWLALLLSPSHDPKAQAEARAIADEWFAALATPAPTEDATLDAAPGTSLWRFQTYPETMQDEDWRRLASAYVALLARSAPITESAG